MVSPNTGITVILSAAKDLIAVSTGTLVESP
jgi:hypothetical protein